jgi:hypothetical protein
MKFGILKSKIEKLLAESYTNNTFKKELSNFKKLVLENKNISKVFYLYDELNSNKGLNESMVETFINECSSTYEKTIVKIKTSEISLIKEWVKNIKSDNVYNHIDDLFSDSVLTIESRIKSKTLIKESLKKTPTTKKETLKVPVKSMISIANKTIVDYLNTLNESDKEELIKLLSENDDNLSKEFPSLQESVISKLESLKEGVDEETKVKITDTITKVKSEKYDKLSYYKLKGLKENL